MPVRTFFVCLLNGTSALAAAAAVVLPCRLLYGRGITADELVSYLAARPHPSIASRSPVVPEVRPWGLRAPYTDVVSGAQWVPCCGRCTGVGLDTVGWTTDRALAALRWHGQRLPAGCGLRGAPTGHLCGLLVVHQRAYLSMQGAQCRWPLELVSANPRTAGVHALILSVSAILATFQGTSCLARYVVMQNHSFSRSLRLIPNPAPYLHTYLCPPALLVVPSTCSLWPPLPAGGLGPDPAVGGLPQPHAGRPVRPVREHGEPGAVRACRTAQPYGRHAAVGGRDQDALRGAGGRCVPRPVPGTCLQLPVQCLPVATVCATLVPAVCSTGFAPGEMQPRLPHRPDGYTCCAVLDRRMLGNGAPRPSVTQLVQALVLLARPRTVRAPGSHVSCGSLPSSCSNLTAETPTANSRRPRGHEDLHRQGQARPQAVAPAVAVPRLQVCCCCCRRGTNCRGKSTVDRALGRGRGRSGMLVMALRCVAAAFAMRTENVRAHWR